MTRDYPAGAPTVYRTIWLSRRAWRRRDARLARARRATAVRQLRRTPPNPTD